jgi:FdhD protein
LTAVRGDGSVDRADELAVEEPLEIRVVGPDGIETQIAVTMRTPGHDVELAAGFLFTEGLLRDRSELEDRPARELLLGGNVVTLRLTKAFDATRLKRNFYATSSCGVCGKAALEHVAQEVAMLPSGPVVLRSILARLPETLAAAQPTFLRTGGLHATGLFDTQGSLLLVREDVGRHNAMDKMIGRRLLDGALPLGDHVVLVSGRTSFELVQKAAMAGARILCAVSAPSSLAVDTAEKVGMTLLGFVRDGGFNVYHAPERVALD